MTRWMKVVCTAAVVTGCSTNSNVAPDADIVLTGKVLLEDGQPVANTLLTIHRSTNSECSLGVLFGDWNWKSVKTGAEGAFTLDLLGADTQNGSTARCFILQPPETAKGRTMSLNFLVQQEQVQLPTLQEWGGAPAAAASTNGVNVTFQPIPTPEAGATAGSHIVSVQQGSSGTLWAVDAAQSGLLLNDYILEDVVAEASVHARRELKGSGTTFTLSYDGDSVALPRRARVPASRGARCVYPDAPTVCPLTDGTLGSGGQFTTLTREVVLQLAQPKVLRKAVLHNLETWAPPRELVLEGSSDGVTWVPLANLHRVSLVPAFQEVELKHPTALSQVRVRLTPSDASSTSQGLTRLSELSLFE
jgi:hypothetical protein